MCPVASSCQLTRLIVPIEWSFHFCDLANFRYPLDPQDKANTTSIKKWKIKVKLVITHKVLLVLPLWAAWKLLGSNSNYYFEIEREMFLGSFKIIYIHEGFKDIFSLIRKCVICIKTLDISLSLSLPLYLSRQFLYIWCIYKYVLSSMRIIN